MQRLKCKKCNGVRRADYGQMGAFTGLSAVCVRAGALVSRLPGSAAFELEGRRLAAESGERGMLAGWRTG